METVIAIFEWGHTAESQGQPEVARKYYTQALELFHSFGGKNHDPLFWSEILFSRAGVFLRLQRYDLAINDVKCALSDCPQQISNLAEAQLWLNHGRNIHHSLAAVWCYTAALHFAGGETKFQSLIRNYRALSQYDLGNEAECDQDIKESKQLDFDVTLQTGAGVKHQAIEMYRQRNYVQAVHLLQLAEKYFRLLCSVELSLKRHWYECWTYIIDAAWSGKIYAKAIQAGSEWQQIQRTSKKEAIGWRARGGEMFNQGNYDNAIACYSLSMQYAPGDDAVLLAKLYSNRSQTFFKKKQFMKAKDDAGKCLKHHPDWSKREAIGWKEQGNKMFKQGNYGNAIECYSLSMQYAPDDDAVLLGTLHSNRSQSFLKKKQFMKAKDDADKCLEYRPDWSKSFYRVGSALVALKDYDQALEVLKKGLNMEQTQREDKYEIFVKIMTLVFDWEDGPMKIDFQLPHNCLSRYMKECVDKRYWKSLEVFLLGGGGQQSYAKGEGGIATGNCDLKDISLCEVIKANPKPSMYYELITTLIDHGALVNGCKEKEIPLSLAVNCGDHNLAVRLLKKKANPECLMRSKSDQTPIHAAFKIGLTSGHWEIFQYLMGNSGNSASSTPCLENVDTKGNSLYHLLASGERMWHHTVEAIDLLKKYNIDPTTRNKDGKTPLMTLRSRKDARYGLIEKIVKSFATDKPKKKKRRKKNNKTEIIAVSTTTECKKEKTTNEVPIPNFELIPTPAVYCPTEIEILREKISQSIKDLPTGIKNEARESECSQVEKTDNIDQSFPNNPDETSSFEESTSSALPTQNEVLENKVPLPATCSNVAPSPHDDHEMSDNDDVIDDDVCDVTFDKLTWEVECTSEVWKKLKDKKLQSDKKEQIIRKIKQLANGHMRGSLAKRLVGVAQEANILLFEAKLDRSARIIWERAIAFSPRCSEKNTLPGDKNGKRLYSEVIRIWDIVFDHDTVPRKIEKIVRSYKRGTSCFIKKNLKGIPVDSSSLSKNDNQISIPNVYVPRGDPGKLEAECLTTNDKPCGSSESSKMFFPPGSPEETEYHILKFYAFSNAMFSAMLDNQNKTNFDFPFRVSELEHSVINLKPKPMTSILLLGRSGTGKTTCCLYRLWNNYQKYWQHNTLNEPSIPNIAQFIPRETDDVVDAQHEEEGGNETSTCENRCGSRSTQCSQMKTSDSQDAAQDDQGCCSSSLETENKPISLMEQPRNTVESGTSEESCYQTEDNDVLQATRNEQTFEHLHQAFITKNAVLCKEVQKNFLELNQACFSTRNDVDHQQSSLYKFDQLQEQAWPLFICSRDWLLMLDASLPGKPFFPRDKDGKPLRTVKGWGEEDNNLQEMPVDYSEDEDEDDDEDNPRAANGECDEQRSEGDLDPRREITYRVFKTELWRKMTKKKKVDYHPSLVWTEIISFLKGSVEALHSENGYITLEEYQTIGNKRAPSFTADRETIYELFLAYQRIKRNQGMFDEADVVNSIYHRLEHNIPAWSIHEIYVDETQDFTQAELSVIIRSCRNPNRLFFTGDTAQSIMRGIAFRFSDLRSLFYYMQESDAAVGQEVGVPDTVYELTHNYRSHSGILNLASCVTDLLFHFFPESFDRLARDQGLFEGPKPVLLESCSFSDLAVILRGHKRKTSPIEFGAHQVILVASDEVRDSLPEELSLALVMTIYEAKGLEFDDVLIYNFFKDSQALKEWRVVATYKEKPDEDTNVSETGIAEIPIDSLECKARPLDFNSDQHKILISEFKYLYTALTRARVNVWLFDENEEARAPMFEYFQRRGVVDVKQVLTTEDDLASLQGMFAQKSGKEVWKIKGIFFYGKGLWKGASKCFHMAGEEIWVKKCHAHDQAAKAALTSEPRKLRLEFMKAADLFLDCVMKDEAEKCLYNAREHILLAQLHEKSGNAKKAAKIFQKKGKFLDAARNFESTGNFERAVDCLLKVHRYTKVLNLISRYHDLLKRGEEISKSLRFDQRSESICYQAAKFYLKRGETHLMTDALQRLPSVEDRITFLQKNGCFDEAATLLLGEGKAQEAASLMRSRGRFLEAARFSDDDKFVADCYLLVVRSTVLSKKNGVKNRETEELIEGPLKRADEMYKRCNNVNGQAEVKFARGKFYGSVEDLEEAGRLYYKASNYAAIAECFLLLMNTENDQRKIKENRPIAKETLQGLLHLIFALHKENRESRERTAISMCQIYFGLVDTDDVETKRVPHLEMVRFSDLQNVQNTSAQDDKIPSKEADKLIKNHLFQMAHNLIKLLWNEHQRINDSCRTCPDLLAATTCDVGTCIYSHDNLTRDHFGDRFHALLFLVHLEEIIAMFRREMQRELAKVNKQFKKRLFDLPEFTACEWLYELLFPCGGQFVSSYFLSERDVSKLRRWVSGRLVEFAKSFLWYRSKAEKRWSSSDLFLKVSNLIHIAGAPVKDIYNLLNKEERKFEIKSPNPAVPPGMFRDRRNPGRFNVFSRALERSKTILYCNGDIHGSIHAAVKEFLFSPAKIKALPYPSISNAVMILERHLTACLVLYARLVMNQTIVCLPESYLSMINFWDFVDRPQTTRSTTLYNAIQYAPQIFQGPEGRRKFDELQQLASSMVALAFGEIWWEYDIVSDALCDTSVNWVEAERVLVLALTMLCNCGRGIPEECEKIIREHLLMLPLRQDLPQKLTKCIEDVRNATGVQDVVLCLRKLLSHKPRQERLCDVKWDDIKAKESRRNCQIENYSKNFRFEIDVSARSEKTERRQPAEHESTEDIMSDNYSQMSEDETRSRPQEYNEDAIEYAELVIQRALLKWISRKKAKAKFKEDTKNDPVKCHFQSFKLDKSGCTICGQVQFVDRSSNTTDTTSQPLLHDEEETALSWQSRDLQTFETHCSKGSPHWKKDKSFAKFKACYKERVSRTIARATQLMEEMTKLKNETEVECSQLDLHRLEAPLSRLRLSLKKVEDERSWDAVHLIDKAAEEVRKVTQNIEKTRNRKVGVKSVDQDSGDEDFADDDIDDSSVGHLKDVNVVRLKKKNIRQKSKKR